MNDCFPIAEFQGIRTPFYYYDTDLLRQTLEQVKEAVAHHGNYEVHYAIKANANAAILRIIAQAELGADCVSGGEIQASIEAGFPTDKIVYAGVGKSDWEINLALDNNIFCFNVESKAELEIINQLARQKDKTACVCFRINPNIDAHTHANITTGLAENKFGIAMKDMLLAIREASCMTNVECIGLHFHIGSQILDMESFRKLAQRINELQDILAKEGIHLPEINVGGGLGIDYEKPEKNLVPDFSGLFDIYAKELRLQPGQRVRFELGRSIVGQMGSLISRVLYVKESCNKRFAILDAGMTDLIRPALYQAYHKIEALDNDKEIDVYDVVGPICESSDVFGKDVLLPQIQRGDLVVIRSAGAYGEAMASQYNCRPLAKTYTSDDLRGVNPVK